MDIWRSKLGSRSGTDDKLGHLVFMSCVPGALAMPQHPAAAAAAALSHAMLYHRVLQDYNFNA